LLAAVAVPRPVRRLFTYSVPEAFRPLARRGVRVLVPFGPRKLTGYVVDLLPEGEPAADDLVLRAIEEVLDPVPVLDEAVLELTRWAADYYVTSWGEMIRAALPGMAAVVRRSASITEAGRAALAAVESPGASWSRPGPLRDPRSRAILGALAAQADRRGRGMRVQDLRRVLGERYRPTILVRLVEAGLARIDEAPTASGPRQKLREEVVLLAPVALPPSPAAADATGAPRTPGRPPRDPRKGLGGGQTSLLRQLEEAGGRLPLRFLALRGDRGVVRSLLRRGLVAIEAREELRRPAVPEEEAEPPAVVRLTPGQEAALAPIEESLERGGFAPFLLHGVTGSGKTEIYLRAIETALRRGRRALYLVPEIGLTPLLARRMRGRFGDTLALLHSRLSEGERFDEWRRVRDGRARVVLGPRSALFAPLADLGLVVVDEEHDPSYKQDEYPRYNGRDLAVVRARMAGVPVVLGSATPSLESHVQAQRGKYRLLRLPDRIGAAGLPAIERVDMRSEFAATGRESILSRRLLQALRERLERGEQSLVLLNRRGFSTFVLCRACGETVECRRCSIALTLHLRERRLRCHYCDDRRPVPESCPACASPHLHFGGTGTERLEETLRGALPGARIERLDRDTARGRGSVEECLLRVERGEVDVLLGTQMIAKGHDFPNVTLVGVVGADALLGLPDFRAGERTFQLLSQVAGRSGRGARGGEVILQAFDPDHHAIRAAAAHDYEGFAAREAAFRKAARYPPFCALAVLLVKDREFDRAMASAGVVASVLRAGAPKGIQVLGPAAAPLERLRGEYRVQILLKADGRTLLKETLAAMLETLDRRKERLERLVIDVDPVSTL
jgi:primosomal protein N' (replication factor Y)